MKKKIGQVGLNLINFGFFYLLDVKAWYDEMPRSQKAMALSLAQPSELHEKTTNRIDQYYSSSHCIVCSKLAHQGNQKNKKKQRMFLY
jgi:succinate dehydrogenase/fumarate reductase-like Fe-S protein